MQRVWPEDRWERFSPQELNQSTVGIIGYGSIGREVARLCCAFGAEVLATKSDVKQPEDTDYAIEGVGDPGGDSVHRLYPPQALIPMLKESDYVVVAVPLTPETRGLITAKELEAMKSTAYLVDVSRGGVVNHDDLIEALRGGWLAGAALDVFPEEPLPNDSQLWGLPNVILSPHIAGMTDHYDERAVDLFIENLNRYLVGEALLNQIDLERGY
jgi:phosphoglycerate dehydrogenase-like enzyme